MASDPSNQTTAYIALGANLGQREVTIRAALKALEAKGLILEAVSSLIETDPVDCPGEQGLYLNGVAMVRTTLTASALLNLLLEVEKNFGRIRSGSIQNEARSLDLDLLLYGEEIIDQEGLCVPHPRMHQRLFVLEPLTEIAPDTLHPVLQRSVKTLLAELNRNSGTI